jgi:hypothetical protein
MPPVPFAPSAEWVTAALAPPLTMGNEAVGAGRTPSGGRAISLAACLPPPGGVSPLYGDTTLTAADLNRLTLRLSTVRLGEERHWAGCARPISGVQRGAGFAQRMVAALSAAGAKAIVRASNEKDMRMLCASGPESAAPHVSVLCG